MEWTEYRRLGATLGLIIVDDHIEHRQAEDIAEQDEFLTLVVTLLPGCGQELDTLEPFCLGEFDLTGKVMQMLYQTGEYEFKARIARIGQALDHCLGNGLLVEVAHLRLAKWYWLMVAMDACLSMSLKK